MARPASMGHPISGAFHVPSRIPTTGDDTGRHRCELAGANRSDQGATPSRDGRNRPGPFGPFGARQLGDHSQRCTPAGWQRRAARLAAGRAPSGNDSAMGISRLAGGRRGQSATGAEPVVRTRRTQQLAASPCLAFSSPFPSKPAANPHECWVSVQKSFVVP